jgi:hypothetical protein
MANDELTLILRGENISLDDFAKAVVGWKKLVDALQGAVAESAQMDWFVEALETGSAIATVRGIGRNPEGTAGVGEVVRAYQSATNSAARRQRIGYTSAVRAALAEITSVLVESSAVTSVGFETIEEAVEIAHVVEVSDVVQYDGGGDGGNQVLSVVIDAATITYGAVRGRIQTLSGHDGLKFTLYETNTGRAVRCFLAAEDANKEMMRGAWEKLAVVEGIIQRDPATGQALTVRQVRTVQVIPEQEPGAWRLARGAWPTGSVSPEDAVRRGRDE